MSRSAGTGSPLTFRCSRCKLGDWRRGDRGTNWDATGLVRQARRSKRHAPGLRSDSKNQFQYRCRDCGHEGWSCHVDVGSAYRRLPGVSPSEPT